MMSKRRKTKVSSGEFVQKIIRHSVGLYRNVRNPVLFELSKLVPDRIYLQYRYRRLMGKKLHLDPPVTYNEKLNWLKLYDRNPLYTKLADKYTVREYVKERIGEEYLVPLYGVWDRVEDIDFDALPDQFVLKCNHDSGSYIVCRNRELFSKNDAIKHLKIAMRKNYYFYSREWAYKDIPRKIIAEKYLEDIDDKETRDYKFFLFNGEPKFLYIATDRGIGETKFDFFDMDFNHLDVRQHYPNARNELHKPYCFEQMIELARKLASDLRHVRVDFYEINGKVYFSEYTFYNNGGVTPFTPEKWDLIFGEWLHV